MRARAHCSREAVAVACRLHRPGYRSEEDALRALKRRCPGLGAEAVNLLATARQVLSAALELVEEELTTLRKYPYMPGGYTRAQQLVQSRAKLAARFPAFPATARNVALAHAFIYQVL
ncbi:MAG: hypothetical protein JNK75_09600 [Betaproteobacteria bacterium]|nr:hypothetical protein [Betaproteobacteria bacterium]